MHVTDVTLGVYKQNLNAGLLQQHHFGASSMAGLMFKLTCIQQIRDIKSSDKLRPGVQLLTTKDRSLCRYGSCIQMYCCQTRHNCGNTNMQSLCSTYNDEQTLSREFFKMIGS